MNKSQRAKAFPMISEVRRALIVGGAWVEAVPTIGGQRPRTDTDVIVGNVADDGSLEVCVARKRYKVTVEEIPAPDPMLRVVGTLHKLGRQRILSWGYKEVSIRDLFNEMPDVSLEELTTTLKILSRSTSVQLLDSKDELQFSEPLTMKIGRSTYHKVRLRRPATKEEIDAAS